MYKLFAYLSVALACISPAAADLQKYLAFKTHALQMQSWKNNMNTFIWQLNGYTSSLVNDLQILNNSVTTAVADVGNQAQDLTNTVNVVMNRLNKLAEENATQPEEYEAPPVAFHAKVTSSGLSQIAIKTVTLKYTSIDLNDGDAFGSATGLFTAPVSGLYWFYASFKASTGGSTAPEVIMKKGGKKIGYMRMYYSYDAACTTMLILDAGDTVGIYPVSSTLETWSITGGHSNTFIGYLVAKYDDDGSVTTTSAATTAATTVATTVASTTSDSASNSSTASTSTSGSG